jgi:hypothetical protein
MIALSTVSGGRVEPTRYRICVRGRLTQRLGSAFAVEEMVVETHSSDSALICRMRDQAELYGVLDRIRDLGLELVSVCPQQRD